MLNTCLTCTEILMPSTVNFIDCHFCSLIFHTFIKMREKMNSKWSIYFWNVSTICFHSVLLTLFYYWYKSVSFVSLILLILCCTFYVQRAIKICTTELQTSLVLLQLKKTYGYFMFPLHFLNISATRCHV